MIAGTCRDANEATEDGRFEVSALPCAFLQRIQLRFKDCEMRALLACKINLSRHLVPRQTHWGYSICGHYGVGGAASLIKQLVAMPVENAEQCI